MRLFRKKRKPSLRVHSRGKDVVLHPGDSINLDFTMDASQNYPKWNVRIERMAVARWDGEELTIH